MTEPKDTKLYRYLNTAYASARMADDTSALVVLYLLRKKTRWIKFKHGRSLTWRDISDVHKYFKGLDKSYGKLEMRREFKSLRQYLSKKKRVVFLYDSNDRLLVF